MENRSIQPLFSLIALAQHYGVPTSLLDWTRNPLVAVFFAADTAFKMFSNGVDSYRQLVVYAFKFPQLGRSEAMRIDTSPIWIVTAPSASNMNLKAQQGLFTMLNVFNTRGDEMNYPPLDQFLTTHHTDQLDEVTLQKFSLSIAESPELLRLLAKLDVTYSAIYPGYDSIVNDLFMSSVIEKHLGGPIIKQLFLEL